MENADLTLAQRLEVEAALDVAFEPLRHERARVSATRVRAAVKWGRGAAPEALPWTGAIRRLSELSVAVGMSVAVFVAAFGGAEPAVGWQPLNVDAMRQAQHLERQTAGAQRSFVWDLIRLREWVDPTVVVSQLSLRQARYAVTLPQPHETGSATGPY
jgi:hypothetical protein